MNLNFKLSLRKTKLNFDCESPLTLYLKGLSQSKFNFVFRKLNLKFIWLYYGCRRWYSKKWPF